MSNCIYKKFMNVNSDNNITCGFKENLFRGTKHKHIYNKTIFTKKNSFKLKFD